MEIVDSDNLRLNIDKILNELAVLNEKLLLIKIDLASPKGFEAAIHEMEKTVDEQLGLYSKQNATFAFLVEQIKQQYRDVLNQKADSAQSKHIFD